MTYLTVDETSPYHWLLVMGYTPFTIRLNGIAQKDARVLDTEQGFIERYARLPTRTGKGRYRYKIINDEIQTEYVHGKVEIIPAGENVIEKGFFQDHLKYLNGVALSFETEYLLTAPVEELMTRQRNREPHYTITRSYMVQGHDYLISDEYRERIKELFEADHKEAMRQWLYGEWS